MCWGYPRVWHFELFQNLTFLSVTSIHIYTRPPIPPHYPYATPIVILSFSCLIFSLSPLPSFAISRFPPSLPLFLPFLLCRTAARLQCLWYHCCLCASSCSSTSSASSGDKQKRTSTTAPTCALRFLYATRTVSHERKGRGDNCQKKINLGISCLACLLLGGTRDDRGLVRLGDWSKSLEYMHFYIYSMNRPFPSR